MSVNKNFDKIDGIGLAQGQPAYVQDLAPDNSLIVKILRSPHAYAKILDIKTQEAEKTEGIECIFTYKNVPDTIFTRAGQGYPEPSPYDTKILDRYVRYVGDAVAIVSGINQKCVDKALQKIEVAYEILEPVLDYKKSLGNKNIVHNEKEIFSKFNIGAEPKKNLAASFEMEIGDIEKTLKNCDVVYEGTFETQAQAHAMTEPHCAFSALDYQNRLIVTTSTQTPFHVRRILAKSLNLPLSKLRVIKPRIGGGFGGKQGLHGEFYVSLVTLKTGKPAKIVYTRQEVFESTYSRHAMQIKMRLGSDKNGNIKAVDMCILSNTGAYGEHALTVLMVAGSKTLPLYNKAEAIHFKGDVVYTNLTPAGAYRGYGAIQGNFALESAIDELAAKLKMDPIELREKNIIKEGETSKVFEKMGEGQEGTAMIVDSCKLDYCIARALEKSGWKEKYPKTELPGNKVRSVGLAIAMQGSGIPYIDMGSAILKLNDDGFFNLLVGATDLGTGSDTILAQIAAEVLNINAEKIIVYSSDTDLTPFDTGAYASSTTYVSGHSVRIAAENMKKLIIDRAKRVYKTEKVEFLGEKLIIDKEEIKFSDFATEAYYSKEQETLVASGSYFGIKSPPPYMAGVAEVEINKRSGELKVLNYTAIVDCGTTINPNLAKIQVEGGLLQGIGMALYEEANFGKNGRLLNNNFLTYKCPTRMEVGKIDVEFAESYESSGPFGAKSVGEIGIDTPLAAIANAIKNASGKRIHELPLTSEKIWNLFKNK